MSTLRSGTFGPGDVWDVPGSMLEPQVARTIQVLRAMIAAGLRPHLSIGTHGDFMRPILPLHQDYRVEITTVAPLWEAHFITVDEHGLAGYCSEQAARPFDCDFGVAPPSAEAP